MSTIDERIVRMEFDNKQFENGVSETMSSLQKLKMALNLRGSEKGMQDVQKAANTLDFSAVNDRIYQVQQNFSFFGEFVRNVFDRISNKIIDLGSTIARELTTEPLKAGFSEYELQMDSTQTIMASTGKSIEEVTGYLDELNTYADKTIYSFSDMTANIGKFTNAGVELEDAVAAIQGISNEAAISGANANEASRAMYNFSQALSAGSVKLIDWKSIENANMATKGFKEQLIDTAVVLGTVKKTEDGYVSTTTDLQGKVSDTFTSTKGFNESLSAQWMTTEVLTETLKHYSSDVRDMSDAEKDAYEERLKNLGYNDEQIKSIEELGSKAFDSAQDVKTFSQLVDTVKESLGSGWTKSFQYMIGNLEEAKVLWTGVNKEINAVLDPIANAREEMLKFWHDNGGRDKAIEAIRNAWEGVKSIMGAVSDAFNNVFPPMTGKKLLEITESIHGISERFKTFATSNRVVDTTRRIFEGLFNAVKAGVGGLKIAADYIRPFVEAFKPFASILFTAAGFLGDFVTNVITAENPILGFKNNLWMLESIVVNVARGAENLVKSLLDLVGVHIEGNPLSEFLKTFIKFAHEHFDFSIFDSLGSIGSNIASVFSGLADALGKLLTLGFGGIGSIFSGLLNGFDGLFTGSKKAAEGVKPLAENILPTAGNALNAFAGFLTVVGKKIGDFASKIGEKLPQIFEYLGSSEFHGIISNFNAAMGGGLLVSLRNFVETLRKSKVGDGEKKKGFFASLTDIFSGVGEKVSDTLDSLTDALSNLQESIKVNSIVKVALAIGILAGSIALLASIDSDKVATGIAAISACFGMLVGSIKALDSGSGAVVSQGLSTLANSLIKMSIAVGILSLSVKALSKLNMDELKIGLGGIIGILGALVLTVAGLSRFGGDISSSAKSFITLAIALGILTFSVKSMSKLNVDELKSGLIGVGILLGEIAVFSRIFSSDSLSVGAAVSILGIAFALKLLSSTVSVFSGMRDKKMTRGLEGVAALLLSIALFSRTLDSGGLSVGTALAVLTTVAALKVLEGVTTTFAALKPERLGQGLKSVAVLLLSIAIFSKLVDGNGMSIKTALSIGMLVLAISKLSEVVTSLGGMSWEQLSNGLNALATSVILMVASLVALSYGSTNMLAGAAAMVVMAAALRIFIPVLQTLGSMSIDDITKALGAFGIAMGVLVISAAVLSRVAPLILTASAALAAFAGASLLFGASILVISAGITALSVAFTALGAAIVTNAGIISVGILSIITSIAIGIANGIIQAVVTLANGIGDILAALTVIIHAVGDFIVANIPYILSVVGTLVVAVLNLAIAFVPQVIVLIGVFAAAAIAAIVTFIPVIANALVTGAVTLMNSLANGIRDNSEAILAAVRNILSSVLELILTAIADLLRMIPGVGDMLADQVEAGKDAVQKTLAPETLEDTTKGAMDGATKGIENGGAELASAAGDVGEEAKESIAEQLTDGSDISTMFMGDIISGFTDANGELSNVGTENIDSYLSPFINNGDASDAGSSVNDALLASIGGDPGAFQSSGDIDMNAFINAFSTDAASKAGSEMANASATGAGSRTAKHSTSGKSNARAYTHAITSTSAFSAGKTLGNSGSSGASSTKSGYTSAGGDVASGFNWGVASPYALSLARAAGAKLGNTALGGIKAAINSGSPSKEAMKLGRWTTEGYAIGIESLTKLAYDKSVGVGQKALGGIRDSISAMSKYVSTDIDMDPTICPVLDLSEIQNGISQIDGMFNRADEALVVSFNNGSYANGLIGSLLRSGGGVGSGSLNDALNTIDRSVNINVTLQYDASADANDLARGIASAVQPYVVRGE